MSDADWFEDDHEIKVDLRLWQKLLAYTLHYRRTAVAFTLVALGLAVDGSVFPDCYREGDRRRAGARARTRICGLRAGCSRA